MFYWPFLFFMTSLLQYELPFEPASTNCIGWEGTCVFVVCTECVYLIVGIKILQINNVIVTELLFFAGLGFIAWSCSYIHHNTKKYDISTKLWGKQVLKEVKLYLPWINRENAFGNMTILVKFPALHYRHSLLMEVAFYSLLNISKYVY